jgi:hypothetical protein
MTYTINGKEWTKADINKQCAELMGIYCHKSEGGAHAMIRDLSTPWVRYIEYNPCGNPSDTDAIIDKCWDELIYADYERHVTWEKLMGDQNCTKLVAACICYIEINECKL